MAFTDLYDYFGSPYADEDRTTITIKGLPTVSFLADVDSIWKNSRVAKNLFQDVRRYRISFNRFFAPDILYVLQEITQFKNRKSSKYRIHQTIHSLLKETWLQSTIEQHDDILDFSQLRRLKKTLFEHQVETLKAYNEKVPKMQLKGFLLGTPPGCLLGNTVIYFKRGQTGSMLTLKQAHDRFQQETHPRLNWDLSIPTYVRSFTGSHIELNEVHSIVYCGIQDVYRLLLEDDSFVDCTYDNPIMTDQGYVKAHDIIGCQVMCDRKYKGHYQGGSYRVLPSYVKAVAFFLIGMHPTYDIKCIEPQFNFVANTIVVHNSGKTLMSIALSVCLHADLSIFIVPKSTVTTVWFDGIVEELGPTARVWASTHDVPLTENYDYYIFHYEALPMALYIAKKLMDRKKPFIAIDESHNLNEITSVRTQRLIDLTKMLNCENTVFATGTPVKALGIEMIPILRSVDDMFTPDTEDRFKAIYGATAKRANDILRNRLGLISHRIREDAYMTIPPPIEKEIFVRAPGGDQYTIKNIKIGMTKFMQERYKFYQTNAKQYIRVYNQGIDAYEKTLRTSAQHVEFRQYKENVKIIIEGYNPIAHKDIAHQTKEFEKTKIIPALPMTIKNQFKDAISIVKFMKARTLGEALGWLGTKRAECTTLIAQYANLESYIVAADKKTIIFSSFVPPIMATNDILTKKGFKTLQVYGDYTKQITEIINQFKSDPDVNPIIATYKSMSASQTLTVANTILFLDVPFRDYVKEQALHRAYRIGQDTQTYLYSFFLQTNEPNLSTRADEILKWSQSQISSIMGSTDRDEIAGIVKRLHLNPPSGVETLLGMLKGLFGK